MAKKKARAKVKKGKGVLKKLGKAAAVLGGLAGAAYLAHKGHQHLTNNGMAARYVPIKQVASGLHRGRGIKKKLAGAAAALATLAALRHATNFGALGRVSRY